MTTADLKNDQLPNNRVEIFKSNTKQQTVISKSSDSLFNCILKLPNCSSITIPMREDGMINATLLCKAHGKKLLANYNQNKQTKEYLQALSINIGIPILQLFVITVGGNHSGTWVHRKVAIHLAQWLSPSFAVQVSNWLDELFITGKVELGQEKSNKELENKFQKQIKLLTQEKQQAIEEKEIISRQLSSATQNHNKMLKRRRRGVYEIGNVVYIMSHVAFTTYYQDDYYKIGISTQSLTETTPAFTNRLSSYKTGAPLDYKVHYLIYVENNKLIEDILKLKFKHQLNPSNGEWIKSVKLEEIIKSIRHLCDYIGLPCKEHSIIKNKNIVDDGKADLLNDKFSEIIDNNKENIESGIKEVNTYEENTDSEELDVNQIEIIKESEVKQVEMIDEIEKYDIKRLTEILVKFKLPVSGTKDQKKTRICKYAVKNRTIIEEYILNAVELPKQTFCIDCKTEISYKAARCIPCSRKASRLIDRPDYETLKTQYENCGKNMSKLAEMYTIADNALKKWFVKYETELGITESCIKKIKPRSTIKKPSDEELLYDKNVLKLNYTEICKKYDIDNSTLRKWISKLNCL